MIGFIVREVSKLGGSMGQVFLSVCKVKIKASTV